MFVLRRNVQLAAYYEQTGDLVRRHDCLLEIFRIVKSLGEDHPSPQVHGLLATLTRELYRACQALEEDANHAECVDRCYETLDMIYEEGIL